MEGKVVENIMVPLSQYPHVKHDQTLTEAITVMEKTQITIGNRKSLPRKVLVFDDLNILVGMIGRRDIIRGLEPDFMSVKPDKYPRKLFKVEKDPNLMAFSFDKTVKGLQQRAQKKIFEVMRPIEVFIPHDAPLSTAISLMVDHDVSFIPVIKNEVVVGVVRSAELFRELARWLKIK